MSEFSAPNQGPMNIIRVYYTNKALAGTAIGETLKVGYAVCWDMANAAPGETANRGRCVNKPESGNINLFAGVITAASVPTNSSGTVNSDAGWIEIAVGGVSVPAWTSANMTRNTTGLVVTAAQWYLAANAVTTIDTVTEIHAMVGIALETADTSSTAALARVCLKGAGISAI